MLLHRGLPACERLLARGLLARGLRRASSSSRELRALRRSQPWQTMRRLLWLLPSSLYTLDWLSGRSPPPRLSQYWNVDGAPALDTPLAALGTLPTSSPAADGPAADGPAADGPAASAPSTNARLMPKEPSE